MGKPERKRGFRGKREKGDSDLMMRGGMVVAMVMVVVAVGAEVRTHCRENRLHCPHGVRMLVEA